VQLELFADGGGSVLRSALFKLWDVGRRRQRRRVEQIRDYVFSAQDGRGAIRRGGQRQETSLPQQAATVWIRHLHAAEAGAGHHIDAIVAREPFVHEGVIGVQ